MLKIRLKRVGRKNDPSYRVVLIDSHKGPKSGKINEVLGFYDPRRDVRNIKGERVKEWISKGAQVSDTVHNILVSEKVIEGKKINVLPKKSPVVKESPKETAEGQAHLPAEASAQAGIDADKKAPTSQKSESESRPEGLPDGKAGVGKEKSSPSLEKEVETGASPTPEAAVEDSEPASPARFAESRRAGGPKNEEPEESVKKKTVNTSLFLMITDFI